LEVRAAFGNKELLILANGAAALVIQQCDAMPGPRSRQCVRRDRLSGANQLEYFAAAVTSDAS
jgi:hypothetical protein